MHLLPDFLPRRVVAAVLVVVTAVVAFTGQDVWAEALRWGVIAVVLLAAVGMWWWERRLSGPLRRIAHANGWTFTRSAPGLARTWTGTPFGVGGRRRASSVIRGSVGGHSFVAFNYTVDEDKDDRRTRAGYWSVVALDQPVNLPRVEIRSTLGGVEQFAGLDRIEVEHDGFNRKYRVSCVSRKHAIDVLNPRAVEVILGGGIVHARIGGGQAVAWAPGRLEVKEVLGWSRALAAVVDRIPDFVWKDYAPDPALAYDPWTGSGPAPTGLTGDAPSPSLESGFGAVSERPSPAQESP